MSPPIQDPQCIKRRRIEAGLNQRAFATAVGIHPSHVSWIERGLRGASPQVLGRMAKVFGCEIADLMADEPSTSTGTEAGVA